MAGGLDIAHIAYKGTAPALTDLLGGQVDMMFENRRCRCRMCARAS